MDVDIIQTDNGKNEKIIDINAIINYLILNNDIMFKSQQKDESDLSDDQKRDIALEIFNRSKTLFLNRFGNYFQDSHLEYFRTFITEEGSELDLIIRNLLIAQSEEKRRVDSKNRRYEALKVLIANESYFSEKEMMKRNPLLYDQLIGQFMTEEERKARDNLEADTTLVKILMEGIERDNAKLLQNKQEEEEDNAMEEEDTSDDEDSSMSDKSSLPSTSQGNWGEFKDANDDYIRKKNVFKKQKAVFITEPERELLREEFTTLMYRSFLDGKDDFDYTTVDNNEAYDNHDIVDADAEEQYFDSEEPEEENKDQVVSSEDELDMYMNALNEHPSVRELLENISKL